MMDFTNYPLSNTYFGGSEKKIGIIINNNEYMLKFQKSTPFGTRNNHICEYLGSHIFELLGFWTQETYLGTYHDENVVACKNFIPPGTQFVPFNDVGESTLDQDKEHYQYSYDDIMKMLHDNSKLTNVNETISAFWKLYIVDALIGNFDRHGANWGFLKTNNQYRLAPIFDNGSCLFPNLTDEQEMKHILSSNEEMDKRIYTFPTSQIQLDGKKSSYFEVIHSLKFPECSKALKAIYNQIDLQKITDLIDDTPQLSKLQRTFYTQILTKRYEKIIKSSYELIKTGGLA